MRRSSCAMGPTAQSACPWSTAPSGWRACKITWRGGKWQPKPELLRSLSVLPGKAEGTWRPAPVVLAKDGHHVILEKIEERNLVELVVNEEVVFHCNINDLEFGGDGDLDPLCAAARIAVLNAY
uniref:Chromosome 1 C10orf53 homolog n=1 Tax=Equus caballus TaxID=9796 RepID=A0A9L0SSC1_HORSE|nr:UPF0728 protein C10orf53 homolog isoform X1 [Equus caballus]